MTDGHNSEKKEQTTFTVDSTKSTSVTMPSISRLLNRKSFNSSTSSKESTKIQTATPPPPPGSRKIEIPVSPQPVFEPQPPEFTKSSVTAKSTLIPTDFPTPESPTEAMAPEAIAVPEATLIEVTEAEVSPPVPPPPPRAVAPVEPLPILKIQPAQRRSHSAAMIKLVRWELSLLEKGTDPLGKGLSIFFKKSAQSALFLAIQPPPPDSKVPHFLSTSVIQEKLRTELWTGLKWDPTGVPDVWNQLVKVGSVEFPPPGTFTHLGSSRNVIRSGFGITQAEWLLLIRIGPPNACRGVVAVIANQSLITHLPEALPFLSEPAPQIEAA